MTLQEASNFIENSLRKTTQKSEMKIYEKFLYVINALRNRDFSNDEIQSIEAELSRLNLESKILKGKRPLKKTLEEFKDFLKDKYSLISKNYYTNIGVSMGAAFGVTVGVVFGERFEKSLGLALGISLGMLIGAYIGGKKDTKAMNEGRVY